MINNEAEEIVRRLKGFKSPESINVNLVSKKYILQHMFGYTDTQLNELFIENIKDNNSGRRF